MILSSGQPRTVKRLCNADDDENTYANYIRLWLPLSVLLIVWLALGYAKTSRRTISIWISLNFHIQITHHQDTVLLLRVSCSLLEDHEINQLPW
jgi:hypothetical protein